MDGLGGGNADVGTTVGVVGCGGPGGLLGPSARQAGPGSLRLMELDGLTPGNVGRQGLWARALGQGKSPALAEKRSAYVALRSASMRGRGRPSDAGAEQKKDLAICDLVVAAGIDRGGELSLNRWRRVETLPGDPVR